MIKVSTSFGNFKLDDLPNNCPFCHKSIIPHGTFGNICKGELQVLLQCPDKECQNSFIGYYTQRNSGLWFVDKVSKGAIVNKIFDPVINDISPSFIKIYNEAHFAEQEGLLEICGVGYRKALEYLIKDYLIRKFVDLKGKIETKNLGQCINEYIEDARVKSSAKRATWLGNDETHYIRKWEGKNLDDLKRLIELTTHWIIMEHLTDSLEENMSEGK